MGRVGRSDRSQSLAAGNPPAARPRFSYTRDEESGALTVTVPAGAPRPAKVWLQHASTLQSKRRDFRWVRLASNQTGLCKLPDLPLPKPLFGGNCIQPIIWSNITVPLDHLEYPAGAAAGDEAAAVYVGTPPHPRFGHWTGYYLELCEPQPAALLPRRSPSLHLSFSLSTALAVCVTLPGAWAQTSRVIPGT